MQKRKIYYSVRFTPDVIAEAHRVFLSGTANEGEISPPNDMKVEFEDET